jgi:hypothetical protein
MLRNAEEMMTGVMAMPAHFTSSIRDNCNPVESRYFLHSQANLLTFVLSMVT